MPLVSYNLSSREKNLFADRCNRVADAYLRSRNEEESVARLLALERENYSPEAAQDTPGGLPSSASLHPYKTGYFLPTHISHHPIDAPCSDQCAYCKHSVIVKWRIKQMM